MREMKDSGVEWIGEIPKDKALLRNKYSFFFEKGKIPGSTNTEGIGQPYIGASDLDSNTGYSVYTEDEEIPTAKGNDLLVLWDGARAGICGTHLEGAISSTIVKVSSDATICQSFLYWYYKGFEWYMLQCVMGTTIPHMSREYIEQIGIINWPIDEQHRIADYLDAKCTQIDRAIARQQEVIEKLKEYKLSVITEAVTKGLNPDVPMKDSGIEWIGEIPEGWEIRKIRWDFSVDLGKMLDAKQISGQYLGDYLRNTDVQWNSINFENLPQMDFQENESERYQIRAGDLLVCEGGEIGRCAIVPEDFQPPIFYQKALHRVRTRKMGNGNVSFLAYVLFCMSKNQYFFNSPEKATIAHLPAETLNRLRIPSPTQQEQIEISQFLDIECGKIDKITQRKQQLIDKLTEYKKSLIYEAVTGKREV